MSDDQSDVTSNDGDSVTTDQSISEIDKALAAAKNRKAAKASTGEGKPAKAAKEPKVPTEPKRPRLSDEDKAARVEKLATERAQRKAVRDERRAAKLAERAANKSPAHLKKVNKAAEKLGTLGEAAALLLAEATANLSGAELAMLALHIAHHNRVSATTRALNQKVEAGQTVTITGGDPRWIGKTGTVEKAQRIRCYVNVEGANKPVYLFTSDVEVQDAQVQAANA